MFTNCGVGVWVVMVWVGVWVAQAERGDDELRDEALQTAGRDTPAQPPLKPAHLTGCHQWVEEVGVVAVQVDEARLAEGLVPPRVGVDGDGDGVSRGSSPFASLLNVLLIPCCPVAGNNPCIVLPTHAPPLQLQHVQPHPTPPLTDAICFTAHCITYSPAPLAGTSISCPTQMSDILAGRLNRPCAQPQE